MICSQCGFESPSGMRFCGSCGSSLEQRCSRCDFVSPPGFSFCGGCGESLATTVERPAERSELIERHIPSDLKERVLSQRHTIEGERRQVTALLCDMAGFTAMTDSIGPEAAFALMDRIYEILMDSVYEFEGTVNELTGDGILALFGAPVALEDAPQRAIRSALAIHDGIAQFNEEMQRERRGLPPVSMRIGINTGPVVVGTLGNDLRVEFKVVGDTVNLASRLEGLAEPSTTLVTEETFKLAEGLFRFEALGGKSVKGKAGPVPVYQVIAPGTSRTRFDVSTERGLTPFVGRERDLEILFDSYRRAKEGRGQAVSISAEAGLGKSRLLYEFRKSISSEPVIFLEGRCLSYCRGLPYYPLIDLFRSSFDLTEGDTDDEVKAKLGPTLKHLHLDESTTSPLLLELLAGSSGDSNERSVTPEARKALLTRALTEFLVAASENRPVIVAVEDLHWIDRNSEELVNHLLGSISASRILMLLTYRPEYPRTWKPRSYHSQLTLNRLSTRETLAMASHQLGGCEMDEPLEELILEKTEGVPFFVEEFIKSLRDLGLLDLSSGACRLTKGREDVSVPTTIQDVLRARVDMLPDSAKQLLKTASVVGREMSHEMLRELTGVAEENLLADLSVLKDAELFYERGVYPNSTYLFKHALTREVVHNSLLQDQRRRLHRKAGEAIESIHRSSLGEHYGVIAEHFITGDELQKASGYSRLAAKRAHHSGAFPTAIEYARKSVHCISRLQRTDQTLRTEIDARTMLAGYILILGRPHEAREVIEPIIDAALSLDDRSSWPAIFASVGLHELFATEDYASAMEHLKKVLETPIEDGFGPWHWFAGYYLGGFLAWNCDFEEALEHLQTVTSISETAGRLDGVAVGHDGTAFILINQGRLLAASDAIDQALTDAAASHNPTAEALTQSAAGMLRSAQGLHSRAESHLLQGLELTAETAQWFWRSVTLATLGNTLIGLGRHTEALTRYQESLAILEPAGLVPSWQNTLKLQLAHAGVLAGGEETQLDDMMKLREANRLHLYEGLTARLIAQTLLAQEDADIREARRWIETAVDADRANGLDLALAHDHACLAEIRQREEDREGMLDDLARARDLFESCGADGYVEETDRRIELAGETA